MTQKNRVENFCTYLQHSNISILTINDLLNSNLFNETSSTFKMDYTFIQSIPFKSNDINIDQYSYSNLTHISVLCDKFAKKIALSNSFVTAKYNLIKFVYPILILLGIFGNSLSIYVMINKYRSAKKTNNKRHNFSFCLAMLCFADLAILVFGCLREYTEEIFNVSIRSYSIYSCKFFYYACYLFSSFSSYLYAFIAFERWHAVTNPIKYKQKKGKKNKKRIIFIFVFCLFISWPFLMFSTLQESIIIKKSQRETIEFEIKCEVSHSSYVKLTFLDVIFYNFVPFLFAFLFSNLTLVKLVKFRSSHASSKAEADSQSESGHGDHLLTNNRNSITITFMNNSKRQDKRHSTHRNKSIFLDSTLFPSMPTNLDSNIISHVEYTTYVNRQEAKTSNCRNQNLKSSKFKTTVMLLAFPISYLLTTFPVFLIITLQLFENYFLLDSSSNYETEFSFAKTIMYINNSINILFFILFGKSLRSDFVKIFTFRNCRQNLKTKIPTDIRYV